MFLALTVFFVGVKQIDRLISTSFIGPSILSFFIATFVLVMQFLWKYIDEILGTGFTIFELLELIFYYSVTLIPLSVPITVLISSVMVFGDMAEKYELSSMKSAGISMIRIMVPSILIAVGVGMFSFVSSNYLKPAANLQFKKRFISMRKENSVLAFEEGIFNDFFNETIIRIDSIAKNKRDINNILIYDHTPSNKSLIGVLSAKNGKMYNAEKGKYFVMELDSGIQYQEIEPSSKFGESKKNYPFMRTYFDEWIVTFDMSNFDNADGILNFNQNREDMLNSFQLYSAVDSFQTQIISNKDKVQVALQKVFKSVHGADERKVQPDSKLIVNDTIIKNVAKKISALNNLLILPKTQKVTTVFAKNPVVGQNVLTRKVIALKDTIPDFNYFGEAIQSDQSREVLQNAQTLLTRSRDEISTLESINSDQNKMKQKYLLRLNQQFSWSLVCIIFLFIGAPLGSIIRKGGYGYPLLVAILFYMIFIISTIFGEKLVKNGSIDGILAAWMPCLILMPFATILTMLGLRDAKFEFAPLKKLAVIFTKK
ncbi:MAG: LptF/LptG family permease [Lewinellaceae bacterium]|nr:LptF/LptG family permease [Lewinellaceae bacterium]